MRNRSCLAPLAVSTLAVVAACTDENQLIPVMDGTFVAPVADFDPALDAALWDDGVQSTVVVAQAVAQTSAVVVTPTPALPRPLGPLFASMGVSIPSSCVPAVAFVDNDHDGIPATYTATFNCIGTSRVTGRVSITDSNDNSPLGGLTVTFDNFIIAPTTTVPSGRTFNGTLALTPQGGLSFKVTQDLTTTFPSQDPSTPNLQGQYASKETAIYTGESASDPFAAGTAVLDGSGNLAATFNGNQEKRDIARSTKTSLHWNRACRTQIPSSPGYDSGTLQYAIDGDGKLLLVYSGCTEPTRAVTQ
jgi:hypothetical protein